MKPCTVHVGVFEYYFFLFAFVVKHRTNTRAELFKDNSVYRQLLDQYLEFFLPTVQNNAQTPSLQNTNPLLAIKFLTILVEFWLGNFSDGVNLQVSLCPHALRFVPVTNIVFALFVCFCWLFFSSSSFCPFQLLL
jgi:hypothetical protein